MANELTVNEQGIVSLVRDRELGAVLKPLLREIYLFDTYIAGTTHLEDSTVLEIVKEGDGLALQRENNKFDSNAIVITTEDKRKLGYVPEKDNIVFARLMDAGKLLKAKIIKIANKGEFKMIRIAIYLIDF